MAASDLFSLGVVMYQMLTARKAFQRDSLLTTLVAIERETPPPISKASHRVPKPLSDLVMRCLEKDPNKRFASAKNVAEAIHTLENSPTALATPLASKGEHSYRRKSLIALGLLATVALFFAVMITFQTDEGTLTIKAGPGFDVSVENQIVTIRDMETNRIFKIQINKEETLPSGEYQILVEDNQGLKFETRKFQIKTRSEGTLCFLGIPSKGSSD